MSSNDLWLYQLINEYAASGVLKIEAQKYNVFVNPSYDIAWDNETVEMITHTI